MASATLRTFWTLTLVSGLMLPLQAAEADTDTNHTANAGRPFLLTVRPNLIRYPVLGMGGNYVFGGVTGRIAKHTLAHIPMSYSRTQMVLQNLEDFSGASNLAAAARAAIIKRNTPGTMLSRALVVEQELAEREIPSIISIWRIPEWMRDHTTKRSANRVAPDRWPELVAAIGQYLIYLRETTGCEPVALSFNEPDTGVHVKFSAEQHRDAIKLIGEHLAALKLKTKMVLGDLNHPAHSIKYLRPAVYDPAAMKHVAMMSFHSWGGADPDEYADWPALAARLKLPLVVGEAGPDSRALKNGRLHTPELALAEMDQYQEMLLYACPQAILHWEYTADFRLLHEDPDHPAGLRPNFRYALQKHWVTYIPAGSRALEVQGSTGSVYFTAFDIPQGSQRGYSLFITNSGTEPVLVAVTGMPEDIQQLNTVTSSLKTFFKLGPPVRKTEAGFSIVAPAQSISTLTTDETRKILDGTGRDRLQ